jgi:hypothetical protein
MKQLAKAAGVGLVGSLVMFIIMFVGIHVTGIAPFNVPPSAAFLETIGLNIGPVPLLFHFGYGAFWSALLVALAGASVDVTKGLALAGGLWLFMMVVLSPLIGWGVFGMSAGQLEPDATLYLQPGPKYIVITAVLHAIYGGIIGWGNKLLFNR